MKRRFTILTAALALLTFLAVPMGMWGQTRTNQTAFYGFETADAGWTATSFVTNNTAITAHGGSKYGATNGGSSADVKYNAIVESPQSLTCYYTKTTTNTNAGSKFHIQVSSNNSTWTTVASGLGMDEVTKGTWYELTADLSSYSNVYVRVRYDGTSAVRALDDITLVYDDGTTPSTDPEITFTPSSITLDEVMVGNEVSTTFSVGQANLTSDIALSVDNGSLSTSSIAQGAAATTVTWTYTPTTAGAISATVTATSGTATETLAISGTAIAPVEGYDVDFEYATDMYPNWTFNNMTTYQTGSITAHGGTYYGTTGGKATASITTTSTVANPGTLTCYVSKQSGNTTSSTWYIQVSENGSTWTDVESHSATSMSQGSWVEFTADLTDYTNVYVRVYYNGSTAIRNIDDLTLTTVEPSSDPSITANGVTIPYDATSGSFNYTINNPVQGGYLTVDENVSWISDPMAEDGVVIFNTETNPNTVSREGIIRMRYNYHGEILTHNVTITQTAAPVIYSSIPALFEAATDTETSVLVTFNNWVVSGVSTNGKNVFVTDNNGNGFVIYGTDMNNDYAVGDILSGTAVSCTLKKYNGFAELINLNAEDLTITSGGTVSTANVAMADLAGVNTGALVHYEGLICSVNNNKYYLTDGTTTLQVYNAIYAFEALEDGETYNITGIYQQYNTTKEILPRSANDIEEVVVVEPSVTVTPNTISAPFAGADGTLDITYENITEIISFDYYFCDANGNELEDTDPDYPGDWIYAQINDENEAYTLSYIIDANDGAARTAYMKVYTYDDELEEVSAIVTVNQAQYVVDYATLPFEYDGNGTGELPNGFTVSGLGTYSSSPAMKFDGNGDYAILKFNERPGTLTFDIKGNSFSGGTFTVQTSEDGVTYTDLETYTELGDTQHESFDNLGENVRYIKWVYTYKSSGNVGLGNIVLAEYVAPALVASITVNPDEVNVDATPAAGEDFIEGTLDLTWENLEITDFFEDFAIQYYDAEGEELADDPNWIMVDLATQDPNIGEGYLVSYMIEENEGTEARTAYFKVFALGDEDYVYSNLVTISQAAPVAPVTGDKYVKVTSTADLTSGQYLIVYAEVSVAFDGSLETLDAASNTIEVILNDDEIDFTSETAAAEFTIDITAGTIKSASGYYIGQTSDANGLASSTTTAYTNTISFDEDGNANIVSGGAYLRYNIASNQTRFRYYKSSSYTNQKAIQLYKKVTEPATETYTLENITGYTGEKDHYYLIASPVTVDPATVTGMTTGDFDLYYFDQAQEDEWRNYEATAFNLVPGTGYLYAKKATTENSTYTFELTGKPYAGNGTVDLDYDADAEFPGFNLIGNPFGTNANLDLPYYRLNSDGSALNTTTESTQVFVMEGVFVQATNSIRTATFSSAAKRVSQLNVKVTRNRSAVLDNAIIRFDNGAVLGKFQLNPNSTKLYITEGNQDYAVVRSNNAGEIPVSFKAAENGNYTLSVEAENVEASYLHLIDNMTGTDVDLLATPSYSFDARTTDHENRFRLVFNANGVEENTMSNFAYFNGSSWTVNNMGEATLQVVDVMGRVLSTETISGNTEVNLNQAAGVYMLRLVNGNDVKMQKVMVQ